MKTSHLIALTATIVACSAATASARPIIDPPGGQASKPSAPTAGSITANREQISNEQAQPSQAQRALADLAAYKIRMELRRSATPPAPVPLADRTATDDGFPLVLVVAGVAIPLVLAFLVGRPMLGYARQRRHPTPVA
jgi:hypothetical protein